MAEVSVNIVRFAGMALGATAGGGIATAAGVWITSQEPVIGPESLLPAGIAFAGVVAAASLSWRARGMWADLVAERNNDRVRILQLEKDISDAQHHTNRELEEIKDAITRLSQTVESKV